MSYIIVANWKMNMTLPKLREYVDILKANTFKNNRKVIIAPPYTLLFPLFHMTQDTTIAISAQNMFFEEKGAFTGEVSPLHLLDAHVEYVIIGHSERRTIFHEDNSTIAKKLKSAVSHALIPIFCVGESKEERNSGNTEQIIQHQIEEGLSLLHPHEIANIIIAYEPVWAIGTGVNASPDQAQDVHNFIKKFLQKKYFKSDEQRVKILYGGSVTPENVSSLMSMPDIDGALVGGASLIADSFLQIINFKEIS